MVTPGTLTTLNKPEINEIFEIPKGEQKLSWKPDEKQTNAGVFQVYLEDHTLGNLVRMQLLRDEQVMFAGYKIPHPLEHRMEIRVQTASGTTPNDATRRASQEIVKEVNRMKVKFDDALKKHYESMEVETPVEPKMAIGDKEPLAIQR